MLACAALVVLGLPTISASPALASPATDGPGALSHFDLARKDCLGTSRTTASKVWFTVAGGVLSDVYYPTIDNTNVETLQYIVTDGSSFTDLQTRDMVSTASTLDESGMSCRVTSMANSGKYKIVTDYVTDPDRNTLLMRTRLIANKHAHLKLYVRFDPTVNGNGGGGTGNGGPDSAITDMSTHHPIPVAFDTNTATNAANRDYAQPVFAALDGPFTTVTSGYAGGASDGLTQLDTDHRLTTLNQSADRGNIVQVAEVSPNLGDDEGDHGAITFALGFGATQSEAVNTAEQSLRHDFGDIREEYEKGWERYDKKLNPPPTSLPGLSRARVRELGDEYYLSINVVKAAEDKTFPGAIVAGLSSPWGQAVSAADPANTYFGSYREVFARDLYEAWTGLMAAGDRQTARDATLFLFEHQQQADGSMPRNSLVNGKTAPDSFGTQLDEVAYPILMARQLGLTDATLYEQHIKPAANFVVARGPSFGSERWEEQSGFSPSTIAAEIAGLLAGADIADINGDAASARLWRAVADDYQRSIKGWTVTTNGSKSAAPYFIRLSKAGDPNAAVSYNVGNGGPTLDQRDVIDAGFLELSRLGMFAADDADFANSLGVVDATIKSDTNSGPGWHRYNGDGYGDDSVTGHPWAPSGKGTGHLWPALTAERAEQSLQTGDRAEATQLLDAMANFSSGFGLIPEQSWELPGLAASPFGTDPTIASIGFVNGKPVGSASPLVWSAGSFVRLAADLRAHGLVDQPANTVARYIDNTQGQTALTVTTPADNTAVAGSPLTVSGTTEPGNQVDILVTNTDANMAASSASTIAAADGSFTVDLPITGGVQVVNVAATNVAGDTAHAVRTIVFDFVPGTVLLDVADANFDDNGPGNYAYPTAGDFHAGAWDMQRFQVFDDGTNIIFRVQNRDQSATFGSPLGAQLIDVYVHDPAAASTSTAAANSTRNFQIAPAAAWSTLIQVQGFGQRFVSAAGTTLGTVNIRANALSRFITFSVPKASLGQPGPGWTFTVVETGQDGFSGDQARGFAATPRAFQFGVCATATADPHCTFPPNLVPKVIDVLTPPGVLQSDELDYTLHNPVTISGVAIT